MADTALLIIDMQNDFVSEGGALKIEGASSVIPGVLKVLDAFRKAGAPIFHVVRVHRADGSDVEIIRKEKFAKTPFAVEGTWGSAIVDELKPRQGEYVVRKIRMSSFLDTDLDLMLKSLGIKTLVIAGVQTPNCIRTTVFDAIAYNYRAIVVEDATAAKTEAIHRANLADMENIGVRVIKASDTGGIIGG